MEDSTDKRKRARDESGDSPDLPDSETHRVDSHETKIRRVNSCSDVNSSECQLTRVDSAESCLNSVFDSGVQLQDDIFHILDDTDNVPERESVMGLDSVMKSFEDEILAPGLNSGQVDPTQTTGSGEMEMNLGYLFEASDDELGLPPTVGNGDEPGRVEPEIVDLTGFVGFEDDFNGYDEFGFGTGLLSECDGDNGGAGGFVTVDGLFEYAEPAADVLWRSESLQAM
ncbi:uncharacterized protein LOC101503361 [Cicer arietinum]|uniref:Uncharacterized protein LOC101503361 n=1 Tax=Cicer arietinum TaxID=3827 RepID=A0A3Q7K7S3_CICAR|nr:uncharacterized protein LOC101503361 [Cicer arietinum]